MRTFQKWISKSFILVIVIAAVSGCSSVPKEVVELSYVMGEDLESMNVSYDQLIHDYFENLRSQRRTYIDEVWYPRFLENWRDDGELVAIAKGNRIFSETKKKLINTPPGTDQKESLKTLNDWVSFALYAYEVKEEELLKPLTDDEMKLRADVKQAFVQLTRGNATITAHLNSLRKVQEVQDQVLESLNVRDLRDKINEKLTKASSEAKGALNKIKEVDSKVDNLLSQIK